MKTRIILSIMAVAIYCTVALGASAPVIETASTITLKNAQIVDDTIPPPITTDDTATVTSYSNITILANVTGNASWNVSPYYSDGTTYHIGTETIVEVTQDTAWTVSTLGVDIMTVGVDNQGVDNPANTITIKIIPYNQ